MKTQEQKTEDTINISREKLFAIIGHLFGETYNIVALRPQPIPEKAVFISTMTLEALDRLAIIQETADAINKTISAKSHLVIGDSIREMVMQLCGNEPFIFYLKRLKNPFNDPIPHPNWNKKLLAGDLMIVAATFEKCAENIKSGEFKQELKNAAAKLFDNGLSRI